MGTFVILTSLLSLVTPLLSKQIVDIIVDRLAGHSEDLTPILIILGAILGTDVLSTLLTAWGQWVGDLFGEKMQTFLFKDFYQHVLSLHIGYFDNEITGKITNKMMRGIQSMTDFIHNMLNNFLPFFLTAFVTIFLLAHYSVLIAFLLAILFPTYILISHGSSQAWQKHEMEKNGIRDTSNGRVFETISGIRIVKSFAAEVTELKFFMQARKKLEGIAYIQTKQWHLYDFARRLILNVVLFAIFAYIVYWTFHGRYTIGEMTLLIQLVNQARFPLFAMSFILGQIQQASSGSKDFFTVLETKTAINDKLNAVSLKWDSKREDAVEFSSVQFGYDAGKQVLQDVSFAIKQGEKFALVGESGQGKSTIANLMLRFYEPQSGSISISGQNMSDLTQDSLRSNIAVVFQESLLFSGTIMENIRYGKPNASKEEVIAAAKAANAYEFIKDLPEQFESMIGERGVKLSGGQKQRIAIARAMLKDAPLIILDEATSSLDSKSEVLVQEGLDHLLKDRTSIIIAHRLSTIANADHILVLSGGKIAQYGTPHDLLKDKKGMYAQLVALQSELMKEPSEERAARLKAFDLVG